MLPVKYIIQGWVNVLLDFISDIKYKKEFTERMNICSECDKNNHGICDVCHCVLIAKTKSEDSECPLHKWKSVHYNKYKND